MGEAKLPEGADIDRLVELANLSLDAAERDTLAHDLARIVGHVAVLGELSLDEVPPTRALGFETEEAGDSLARARARLAIGTDTPHAELAREIALSQSPRHDDDGFAVPGYADEG